VVAGVRTVTTNMDGRDVLPRLSRLSAFSAHLLIPITPTSTANQIPQLDDDLVARSVKLP
jgi:hypothetical protein